MRNLSFADPAFLALASKKLWTPAQITTALWLTSKTENLSLTGSLVNTRLDISGNGRNFQATTTQRPALAAAATGFNGNNAISYDGVDDRLTRSPESWMFSYPLSFFQVNRYSTLTGAYNSLCDFYSDTGGATGGWSYMIKSNGKTAFYATANNVGSTVFYDGTGAATTAANTTSLFSAHISQSSVETYYNGTLDGSFVPSATLRTNVGSLNAVIGASTQFSRFTPWQETETLIVPGTLTQSTRQLIEGYFAWWYSFQNLLPNHPYKSAPPYI